MLSHDIGPLIDRLLTHRVKIEIVSLMSHLGSSAPLLISSSLGVDKQLQIGVLHGLFHGSFCLFTIPVTPTCLQLPGVVAQAQGYQFQQKMLDGKPKPTITPCRPPAAVSTLQVRTLYAINCYPEVSGNCHHQLSPPGQSQVLFPARQTFQLTGCAARLLQGLCPRPWGRPEQAAGGKQTAS